MVTGPGDRLENQMSDRRNLICVLKPPLKAGVDRKAQTESGIRGGIESLANDNAKRDKRSN